MLKVLKEVQLVLKVRQGLKGQQDHRVLKEVLLGYKVYKAL